MNWTKNGEVAGTEGFGHSAEAIIVKILPKGSPAPANLGPYQESSQVKNIALSDAMLCKVSSSTIKVIPYCCYFFKCIF
ncbi:MAG: hypothetical protein HUJ62_07445 [Streptococcus gallolyticus]|nr:hypothetical protein [Streptococcus gallolyticus]